MPLNPRERYYSDPTFYRQSGKQTPDPDRRRSEMATTSTSQEKKEQVRFPLLTRDDHRQLNRDVWRRLANDKPPVPAYRPMSTSLGDYEEARMKEVNRGTVRITEQVQVHTPSYVAYGNAAPPSTSVTKSNSSGGNHDGSGSAQRC